MKQLLLAITLALSSQVAFAHNCKNEMKAIDAALPATKLDADKIAEVKKLRAEGEALHNAGKHDQSHATLIRAKEVLGIK